MKLWELTSRGAAALADRDPLLLLPIGSVEQHSAHLPTGTDSLIVQAVASEIEARRPDEVVLAPPIWYGSSGHHLGFAGTASVRSEHLVAQLVDVMTALHRSTGLTRFFVLNGHGGNDPAMRIALEHVRDELPGVHGYAASYWHAMFEAMAEAGRPHEAGMGHACVVETSLMLALHPQLVDTDAYDADERNDGMGPWLHRSAGFDRITTHGGMGDPTEASAKDGLWMLSLAADRLATLVDRLATG